MRHDGDPLSRQQGCHHLLEQFAQGIGQWKCCLRQGHEHVIVCPELGQSLGQTLQ